MEKTVVVIGGGVAGLSAVLRLVENGTSNILLIEAGDRLGGRVCTTHRHGGVLEMGAQWIHGRGDNRLWKFINQHNLPVSSDIGGDRDGVFRLPGGQEVPEHIIKKTLEFLENVHEELNSCAASESVGKHFKTRFDGWLEDEHCDRKLKRALFDWFVRWEEVDCGLDSLDDQSIRSWGEYVDYDNQNEQDSEPILSGGYSSLVDKLVQLIGDKAEILTGVKVVQIDWSDTVTKISCNAGQEFTSCHVIVTVGLGVLKETHQFLFHPELPQRKVLAINKLGFGSICKIFLWFDQVFWEPTNPGIQIVHFNEESDNEDEENWWKHIAGFDGVIDQPSILAGWISGKAARMMETKTDEEILETCWNLLQKFSKHSIPRPVFCLPTRWFSDKKFRGTYSYRTPECDELGVGPGDLGAPVIDGQGRHRILFAGEATDVTRYGTVDGAFTSGEREANRIKHVTEHTAM